MGTRLHRAWLVAGVTFLVLLASAAFRSSVGLMLVPLEEEFGWSRSATSLAVSLNLVLYGVTAPFAAALMERFGIRRIVVLALGLMAVGSGLTVLMTSQWQLQVLWGLCLGLGTGATALVLGALVAGRWFTRRRGLVVGWLGAAWATGQLVFLPLIAWTIEMHGWRSASLGIALACLALVPLVALVLADRPADVGLRPYGATGELSTDETRRNTTGSGWSAARSALTVLREAAGSRAFWLLAGTFFVCGWTTNGIVSSHFVPTTHDHGMAATTAAGLLAVVGVFDIAGTLGSGWLSDRFDPRILLAAYYALRGVALLSLPLILGPQVEPPLLVVMMLFGLDWVATVPPTVVLCQRIFGTERGPIVFGWVFASHMVGAAVAAAVTGALRQAQGDYATSWFLAAALALAASLASLAIPAARGRIHQPTPA
ncbi:MAG: MFS transporter [Candidatus Nanopelagicales bacterium]